MHGHQRLLPHDRWCAAGRGAARSTVIGSPPAAGLGEVVGEPGQFLLPALAVPAGDVRLVGALDDPDQGVVAAHLGELDPQLERDVGIDARVAGDALPGHEDVRVEELGVDAVGRHPGGGIGVAHLHVRCRPPSLELTGKRSRARRASPVNRATAPAAAGSVHARKTCGSRVVELPLHGHDHIRRHGSRLNARPRWSTSR